MEELWAPAGGFHGRRMWLFSKHKCLGFWLSFDVFWNQKTIENYSNPVYAVIGLELFLLWSRVFQLPHLTASLTCSHLSDSQCIKGTGTDLSLSPTIIFSLPLNHWYKSEITSFTLLLVCVVLYKKLPLFLWWTRESVALHMLMDYISHWSYWLGLMGVVVKQQLEGLLAHESEGIWSSTFPTSKDGEPAGNQPLGLGGLPLPSASAGMTSEDENCSSAASVKFLISHPCL